MARGAQRPKHVPIRTCIACRQTSAKRTLVRIVRDPSGAVDIDPSGKRSGRGSYLCQFRSCWDIALKRGAIERALNITLSPEDKSRLSRAAEGYPELPPEEAT